MHEGLRSYQLSLGEAGGIAFDGDRDPLTFSLAGAPTAGEATVTAAGEVTISVPDSYVGDVAFSVTAFDGIASSNAAVVTLRIENDAPYAERDFYSVASGSTLTLHVTDWLRNDFDQDGDGVHIADIVFPSGQGQFAELSPNAIYEYSPGAFIGQTAVLYRVSDGAAVSEWVEVVISAYATAPWGTGRSYQIYVGELLDVATIVDRGDVWDFEGFSGSAHVTSLGPLPMGPLGDFAYSGQSDLEIPFRLNDGLLNNDQNGDGQASDGDILVSYVDVVANSELSPWNTPDLNEEANFIDCGPSGETSLPTFEGVADEVFSCVTAPMANARPAATPDVLRVIHGRTASRNLLDNDADPDGDELSITAVVIGDATHPTPFTWETEFGNLTVAANGIATIQSFHAAGRLNLRYIASDGAETSTTSLRVEVTNDAPFAVSENTIIAGPGELITGSLLENDYDPDGDPLTIRLLIDDQVVPFDPATGSVALAFDEGVFTLNSSGEFTFAQSGGHNSNLVFDYQVWDGLASDQAQVKLSLYNRAPVAESIQYIHASSATPIGISPDLPVIDADGDALTVAWGPSTGPGTFAPNGVGGWTFTPPSATWEGVATLEYSLTDAFGLSSTSIIAVELRQPPAGGGGSGCPPTSPPGMCGNTGGGSGSGTDLSPDVAAANDELAFVSSTMPIGNVLANDSALRSPPLYASGGGVGAFGTLTISANGEAWYELAEGRWEAFAQSNGEYFTYTATDAQGKFDTARVWVRPFVLMPGVAVGSSQAVALNFGQDGIKMTLDGPSFFGEGGSYSLDVAGDGVHPTTMFWHGDAGYLRLNLDGSLATPVSVGGEVELYVDAAGDKVTAEVVTLSAVDGVDEVLGVNVLLVKTGAGLIRRVLAREHVHVVHAGYGPDSSVDLVRAGGDVSAVWSGGEVGKVWARGTVGFVRTGLDIVGSIRAETGSIGGLKMSDDYFNSLHVDYSDAHRGVTAGGSIGLVIPRELGGKADVTAARGKFLTEDDLELNSTFRESIHAYVKNNISADIQVTDGNAYINADSSPRAGENSSRLPCQTLVIQPVTASARSG